MRGFQRGPGVGKNRNITKRGVVYLAPEITSAPRIQTYNRCHFQPTSLSWIALYICQCEARKFAKHNTTSRTIP